MIDLHEWKWILIFTFLKKLLYNLLKQMYVSFYSSKLQINTVEFYW